MKIFETAFLYIALLRDHGVFPMLAVIWPICWLLLIPTILMEQYIIKKYLPAIPSRKIFWSVMTANIISTVIVIPITWILLAAIEIFIRGDRFSLSYNSLSEFWKTMLSVTLQTSVLFSFNTAFWTIFIAGIFLLIPFYFATGWIKGLVLTKIFNISPNPNLIKKTYWKTNIASYALLLLAWLSFLFLPFFYFYNEAQNEIQKTEPYSFSLPNKLEEKND